MKRIYLLLVFIMIITVVGCNSKPTNITLVFNTDSSYSLDPLIITDDNELNLPNLTKEGHTFLGWYLDNNIWQEPVTKDIFSSKKEAIDIFPRWQINEYTISFENDLNLNPLNLLYNAKINLPTPEKDDHIFLGWYTDNVLTKAFSSQYMPAKNITLYAKWEANNTPHNNDEEAVRTEERWIFTGLYGNTNGNLNNGGLATYYDTKGVHYYSSSNSVYEFDPKENKTSLLFSLGENGKATYLNLNKNELYFIENESKHLLVYNLETGQLTTLFEQEYCYLNITSYYLFTLKLTQQNDQIKRMLNTYNVKTNALIKKDFTNIEFISIDNNRVYHKTYEDVALRMMNYNGVGKTTVAYLDSFGVNTVYDVVLYQVLGNTAYYAFVADFKNQQKPKGLYFYDEDDIIYEVLLGNISSINYHDKSLFVIKDDNLIEISFETKEIINSYSVPENSKNIQIINNWIYYLVDNKLYRIDPVTKESSQLFKLN